MKNRVLIVDDNDLNREILEELLAEEYELALARSGEECLELLPRFSPDLVLLDIMMPGLDGYEVCRRIKSGPMGPFTQVILVSGKASAEERVRGYQFGADGYVVKPFDHEELLAKVHVHFRLRDSLKQLWTANEQIRSFNSDLERLVQERSSDLVATREIAIFALAKLAESRDPETGEHLHRMQQYCRILAEQLRQSGPYAARIDDAFVDTLHRTSPLHDIGKVGIPDAVLLKPGQLDREEFAVMKRHTTIGAEAIREAAAQATCGSFLAMAEDIARHHHERYDGLGYPDGLSGDEIPLAARIVAVADVYDALTSPRVYKPAFDPSVARSMIEAESGKQFDPLVVDAFRARHDDFLAIAKTARPQSEWSDGQPLCPVRC